MSKSTAIVSWLQFPALLVAWNLSAATHLVSQNSANPSPPYSTWATAATNIQQAVNVAAAGDMVLVSNGVYAGPVVMTNPVLLASYAYAGQQFTFIDGHRTNRCVWMTNGARLYGFTLTNGFADNGGGVWCSSTNANVTNCVIVGNSASIEGGGAWGGTLGRCTLSGNSGGSGGGASSGTLDDCILTNNSCNASGGGVYKCTLNNCLLTGNIGNTGGGAFGGTLNNCTLSGNQANSGGGAGSAALNNSIVYFNSAPTGTNADDSCTLNYCCTTPLPGAGAGNIDLDPQFLNLAGRDFRLQPGSPCIDAGNNALVVDTSDLDLAGGPRIVGGTVDMGAYEFPSPNVPVLVVQPLDQTVDSGHDVNFGAAANGAAPLFWQWYFNGSIVPGANATTLMLAAVTTNNAGGYSVVVTNYLGSVTSQVAVLTVVDAAPSFTLQPLSQSVAPGNYFTLTAAADGSSPLFWQWQFNGTPIGNATSSSLNLGPMTEALAGNYTVVASNAFGNVTSAVATVSLAAGAISYVWTNSPSPTVPYSSWATAAHTIQDAVNAAGTGYQIVVTNGVYPGGLNISKPLTVVSVNGPQVTVINGGGPCVSLTNGASLTGFTLTNGYGLTGGGVSCLSTNAFLTNCMIAGNNQGYGAWLGGGAYLGTLYNCTLTGNQGTNNAGGAYGSTLINCVVSNNIAGGVNSCTLFNSLVVSNLYEPGSQSEGGAANSTLYNCTLVGNGYGVSSSAAYNCVIFYNSSAIGGNYDSYSTLNYCCTTAMPANGVGNITNAPLFVDLANGNLRLQSSSPCINAGNNAYVTTTTDLDGNPRIVSGTVDIGAYEYQGTGSRISYAWLQYYGLPTDGSADFIDSDADGMNNWQEWICGTDPTNAASVLKMLSPRHTAPGIQVPWLSVTNRTYFVQRSTDLRLRPAFVTLFTNVAGQLNSTTVTDTNAAGAGPFFYRVGVRYP